MSLIVSLKLLGVCLTLCSLLTRSKAGPLNSTVMASRHLGLCQHMQQHSLNVFGFVPQCNDHGNFLPQQCSELIGECWCVDILSGEELPNTRSRTGTAHLDCDREYYCPYGWSRFGKHCFTFIDSPKTWAEAESYCLFEGANLASIHSYEEGHFIQALTRGDTYTFPETWIGGHDAIHHCFWMWSDGSKFVYENWYKDHDVPRTEHCLKMNYGYDNKWTFASCTDALPFVCAKLI